MHCVHSRGSFALLGSICRTPWGSSGSFACAWSIRVNLRVVGFVQVHSAAPWRSSGSFGSVRSITVRTGGCWVVSALRGVGFVRVSSANSRARWESSSSFT